MKFAVGERIALAAISASGDSKRIKAEKAMADAEMYAKMASEKGTAAATAAMAELMIIGKDKNVGEETFLNADDGSSVVTTDGVSEITGRMKGSDPMHMVAMVPGVRFAAGVDDAADTPHTQAVAAHEFSIGRTLSLTHDMTGLCNR